MENAHRNFTNLMILLENTKIEFKPNQDNSIQNMKLKED